jgi:DNA-binding CsgD family transcriptional regulator
MPGLRDTSSSIRRRTNSCEPSVPFIRANRISAGPSPVGWNNDTARLLPKAGPRQGGPSWPRGSPGGGRPSRETEVLQLIAEGFGNKQIGYELKISIKTVEKHRQQVMNKLNIHETAGLTRYAIAKGVVEFQRPRAD